MSIIGRAVKSRITLLNLGVLCVWAALFSLSPSPSLSSLHSAGWYWGQPLGFLQVYQDSENPGHNSLQGAYYWEPAALFADYLIWLMVFVCAALLGATISKKIWERIRPNLISIICFCLPLVLWMLYLWYYCGNYFRAFF
jgi:hypothetical protein